MNNLQAESPVAAFNQAVVASYRSHSDAESAIRRLAADGIPLETISIIGRNFETHEDIQGFYRPADAAKTGAGQGAWFGGFFGLLFGAMGFFVFPIVGPLFVLGPLASMIAGAVGGAGSFALVNALVAAGAPKDHALKYQDRLQVGEFLVIVHGGAGETKHAHDILIGSAQTDIQIHGATTEPTKEDSKW